MRRKPFLILFLILLLTIGCGVIIFPSKKIKDQLEKQGIRFRLGLDLKGGTQLTYDTDTSKIPEGDIQEAMVSLKKAIERRVNAFGVSEPTIQTTKNQEGQWRLIIALPGIKDFDEALKLIGQTAHLEFKEENEGTFMSTGLEGKHLKRANSSTNPQTGEIVVELEFNAEGSKLFAEITKRNIGKNIAIYLDNNPISIPQVREEIKEGKAIISGNFDLKGARSLAIALNAGALPIPIKLVSQTNIEASLGEKYLKISLFGGALGIFLVSLFMIIYYRLPGLIATITLFIYSFIVLAIFKISGLTPWPVVLTLSGIAGFVLSVAMAIDGNILIFERMKEELSGGQTILGALEGGFKRAWKTIKDAYISSLITCGILYWFGTGLVRGFALTLALGLLTSLFTAVFITRLLMRVLIQKNLLKREKIFGIKFSEG